MSPVLAVEDRSWLQSEAVWTIRLLGRLEVVSSTNEPVRFRSRTALSLLAYLSLHKPKEIACETLHELFWPGSDGDRQAQNLRRAIADIRKVLERDSALGTILATRKACVSLSSDRVSTDVERFMTLTAMDDANSLAEAIGMYAGPLLAPIEDDWVMGYRMEMEERFGQAVERLCRLRVESGSVKDAVRIGRAAAAAAPMREDIHVALIKAFRSADMEAEAIRQYELLERMLDDHWGEVPSTRARRAMEQPRQSNATRSSTSPVEHDSSGGALPLGSDLYIRRGVDEQAEELIRRREGVVLVQGPRQVGKSSLLARVLSFARAADVSVVFTDVQSIGESQLAGEGRFYRTLAHGFAAQLGMDLDIESEWSEWLGSNVNLDSILGKLLARCEGPVCWAIDEADLLFDRPYTNDFFGLLRSWHNRRALSPHGPWSKLTLILTYATEANLFITDLNQSPFNVGVRIGLRDFSEDELYVLQSRYGIVGSAWQSVYDLTHGHPYLSQCAYSHLARGGTLESLAAQAHQQDGPFGPHLSRVLVSISQSSDSLSEVKRLLRGEPFIGSLTRYRLQSAGVISITDEGGIEFRVPVYRKYLLAHVE